MAKIVKIIVKLALPAGKATTAAPVGPSLGQHGINISAFCKEYNLQTTDKIGLIVPVKITIFTDKTYTFVIKSPTTATLLLNDLNLKKGSVNPKFKTIGSIDIAALEKIAKIKMNDLNTKDLKKAVCIITGTAKNMGIQIID